MELINKVKRVIERPERLLIGVELRLAHTFHSQKLLLKALYRLHIGRKLNLKNPKTFTMKTQWLKLNDHNPIYHRMVDKYDVKFFVSETIGQKYVIPTLGVWDTFDNINFDNLPDMFVLKTTNGGGSTGVIICKDKAFFDKIDAKSKIEKSMSNDIYRNQGEWSYKGLKPRIIAEKFMSEPLIDGKFHNSELNDYKFWCFNGDPKILFYASGRFNENNEPPFFDYFDMNLKKLQLKSIGHRNSPLQSLDIPQFDEMMQICKVLSKDIPFVRVDLYMIGGKVYFGELTFYHDSGFVPFEPAEWDEKIGKMLSLKLNYT